MYLVLNNDREELGSFKSIPETLAKIEQYFQCGIKESTKSITASLNSIGYEIVTHSVFEDVTCTIANKLDS